MNIRLPARTGGQYAALGLLVVAVAALSVGFQDFRTSGNIENLLVQATPLLIVAIGQTLVVLTNGLDLSVGAMISLTTAIIAVTGSPLAGVALSLGAAVVLGVVNGVGVARFKVHPIIMTLATATLLQGVVLVILPTPGGAVAVGLVHAANGELLGIPLAILWSGLALLVGALLLHKSRFGLHLYSIGGGADNAKLAGVHVTRTLIASYVVCALFAALAGVFMAGRISSGDPWVGASYGLDSIAAVAVGGTQLIGGIGGLLGTACGALLLGLIGNGLNLMQVDPFFLPVVNGSLLLLAVCLRRRKELGL